MRISSRQLRTETGHLEREAMRISSRQLRTETGHLHLGVLKLVPQKDDLIVLFAATGGIHHAEHLALRCHVLHQEVPLRATQAIRPKIPDKLEQVAEVHTGGCRRLRGLPLRCRERLALALGSNQSLAEPRVVGPQVRHQGHQAASLRIGRDPLSHRPGGVRLQRGARLDAGQHLGRGRQLRWRRRLGPRLRGRRLQRHRRRPAARPGRQRRGHVARGPGGRLGLGLGAAELEDLIAHRLGLFVLAHGSEMG
mmetsp:Transcript_98201/g.316374  ORF Transcript_98201/g.316374 Transcript_98201/m.316374 type:complete len:252 (+) Transcript_98201:138-893(+)